MRKQFLAVLLAWLMLTSPAWAARSFNGSSQSASTGSTVTVSGLSAITVAFWLKVSSFGSGVYLESSPNSNSNTGAFSVTYGTTGSCTNLFYFYEKGTSWYQVVGFTAPSTGAWHQFTLVIGDLVSASKAYVDGGSQSLTTCSSSGTGSTFTNQNLYLMARNNASGWTSGSLAEVAVFAATLNANQALALASCTPDTIGVNPVFYAPMWGADSPEPELSGNANNVSLTGTPPMANHPPVKPCGRD